MELPSLDRADAVAQLAMQAEAEAV
eukprot:COSAG06_NODE_24199_length_669_cov_4.703509_1_plen_24_part_10